MKKINSSLIGLLFLASALFVSESAKAAEPVGISYGLDYINKYMWRGTYFYKGSGGAFVPNLNWSILNSGFTIGYAGEYSDQFVGDGKGKDQNYWLHSADLNAGFTKTFEKRFTLSATGTFWWYYNSKESKNPLTNGNDASYLSGNIKLKIDALPLSPYVSYTHDFYLDKKYTATGKTSENYYIQAGASHSVELTKEASATLALSAGYFNYKSQDIKGISDISPSIIFAVKSGGTTFAGSFNYIFVPTAKFAELNPFGGKESHRFYAKVGASYSF